LQKLETPIISLRWRRVTFIHTTWDRFQDASEINDLFVEGGEYVDRLYMPRSRKQGCDPERNYIVREGSQEYEVPLAVPCQQGEVTVTHRGAPGQRYRIGQPGQCYSREVVERGGIC
jgi:hypothetical protein